MAEARELPNEFDWNSVDPTAFGLPENTEVDPFADLNINPYYLNYDFLSEGNKGKGKYGIQATEQALNKGLLGSDTPFRSIIVHEDIPVYTQKDLENKIIKDKNLIGTPRGYKNVSERLNYYGSYDPGRSGYYGYHFAIDGNGDIYQTAPFDVRTNHIDKDAIKPEIIEKLIDKKQREALKEGDYALGNFNTIGITYLGDKKGKSRELTPAALASMKKLRDALNKKFGDMPVYSHDQFTKGRGLSEATDIATAMSGEPTMVADAGLSTQTYQNQTDGAEPATKFDEYLAQQGVNYVEGDKAPPSPVAEKRGIDIDPSGLVPDEWKATYIEGEQIDGEVATAGIDIDPYGLVPEQYKAAPVKVEPEPSDRVSASEVKDTLFGGDLGAAAVGARTELPPEKRDTSSYIAKGLGMAFTSTLAIPDFATLQYRSKQISRRNDIFKLFDRIDAGEAPAKVFTEAINTGMGTLTEANLNDYIRGDASKRNLLRAQLKDEIGKEYTALQEVYPVIQEFQEKMAKYGEGVPDFSKIKSGEDFQKWLAFHSSAGTVQLLPVILSTVLFGPTGGFAVGTAYGLQEAVGSRLNFIYDKIKDLPEEVQAELITDYLAKTSDTTMLQTLASGALEVVGAGRVVKVPQSLISKISQRLTSKEVKKEVVEKAAEPSLKKEALDWVEGFVGEAATGGGQKATEIVTQLQLKEKEGPFFTKENVTEIFNAAMAEGAGALGVKGAQKVSASGFRSWREDKQKVMQDKFFALEKVDPIIKGYVKKKMAEGMTFNDAFRAVQTDLLNKKITQGFNIPSKEEFIAENDITDARAISYINYTSELFESGKYSDADVELIANRAEVLMDEGLQPRKAFNQAKKEFANQELSAEAAPRTEQEEAPADAPVERTQDKPLEAVQLELGLEDQGSLLTGQAPTILPADVESDLESQQLFTPTGEFKGVPPASVPTTRQLQLDFRRPLSDTIAQGIINQTSQIVTDYSPIQSEAIYNRAVDLIDSGSTVPIAFKRAKQELADGKLKLPEPTQLDLPFPKGRGRPRTVDRTARETEAQIERLSPPKLKTDLPSVIRSNRRRQLEFDFFLNELSKPDQNRSTAADINPDQVQNSFDRTLNSNQIESIINNTFKLLGRYQDPEAFAIYQRARELINNGMATTIAFNKARDAYENGNIDVSRGMPEEQQLDLALKYKRQPKQPDSLRLAPEQTTLPGFEYKEPESVFNKQTGEYIGPSRATSTEGQQELDLQPQRRRVFPKGDTSVRGFKTAQGSRYTVQPDGQVSRITNDNTYDASPALYVNPEAAKSLSGESGRVRLGYDQDGKFRPVTDTSQIPPGAKPKVGLFNPTTNQLVETYDASIEPAVGLHPVEKKYNPDGTATTHVGKNISRTYTIKDALEDPIANQKIVEEAYSKLQKYIGFSDEDIRQQADAINDFVTATRSRVPTDVVDVLTDPRGVSIGILDRTLPVFDNRDLRRLWNGLSDLGPNDPDHFTQIIKYSREMSREHNEFVESQEDLIARWKKFNKEKKDQGAKLAVAMNESTRVNVDPTAYPSVQDAIAAVRNQTKDPNEIRMVFDAYNSLDQEGKALYAEVRDAYDDFFKQYETALLDNIKQLGLDPADEAQALQAIQNEFAAARAGVEVYFPLKRHGDFWLRVKNGPLEGLYMYETEKELLAHVDDVRRRGADHEYGDKANNPIRKDIQDNAVVRNLMATIDSVSLKRSNGVDVRALKEQVLEMYLQTLPGNNLRSAFLTRKGTKGYSADVLRSFALTVNTMGTQLPKLKYGQKMKRELSAMNDQVQGMPQQLRLNAIQNELRKRVDIELNPAPPTFFESLVGLGNKAVFFWLMTSGKSAFIQTVQYPMVMGNVFQQRFGKHVGRGKVFATHKRYMNFLNRWSQKPGAKGLEAFFPYLRNSSYINNHQDSQILKRAFDEASKQNTFEVTFHNDVADLMKIPDGMDRNVISKGFRASYAFITSWFHAAERFTKEISFMGGFELALDKARKEGLQGDAAFNQAFDEALDALDEGMFDYSNFNKPRAFRLGPITKAGTQFMSFAYFMNSLMLRNFVGMAKKLDGNDRRDAAVVFFGVQANALLLAGLGGVYGANIIIPMMEAMMNAVIQGWVDEDDDDDEKTKLLKRWAKTLDKDELESQIETYNRKNPNNRITQEDKDKQLEKGAEAYYAGDPFFHNNYETWLNQYYIPWLFGPDGQVDRYLQSQGVLDGTRDSIRIALKNAAEKGIFSLIGIDLSKSLSLNGFWVQDKLQRPDETFDQNGISASLNFMTNIGAFPVVSVAKQIFQGLTLIADGEYQLGAEKLSPGIIKGAVRQAGRMREGYRDFKGDAVPYLDSQYYNTMKHTISGILGFRDLEEARLSTIGYKRNAYERGVSELSSKLINKHAENEKKFAEGRIDLDEYVTKQGEYLNAIDQFNNEYGTYYKEITPEQLFDKEQARSREAELTYMNYGVRTPQEAAHNMHRIQLILKYLDVNARERKLAEEAKETNERVIEEAIRKKTP